MSGLLRELDARREVAERHRENSARLAMAYATFTSRGQGSLQFEKRVDFGVTFIEQPMVAYGSVVDLDALADITETEDSDDVILPLTSGFVVAWDQDDRDFFTGCWCAVRVHFPLDLAGEFAVGPELLPEIKHHFTFSAVALKDIPTDNTDAGA